MKGSDDIPHSFNDCDPDHLEIVHGDCSQSPDHDQGAFRKIPESVASRFSPADSFDRQACLSSGHAGAIPRRGKAKLYFTRQHPDERRWGGLFESDGSLPRLLWYRRLRAGEHQPRADHDAFGDRQIEPGPDFFREGQLE